MQNYRLQSTEQVLRRLDKASPKELNRALKTLQQQLNGIQRGSKAWDAQVQKIRMVRAEMQKLNASLANQKTAWQKMNGWLNNCQTAILAVIGAISGLVMAGRKAVQAYADMEETMANTVKYTRMTAEEVEKLNNIFKSMDTRLSREQLNLLAQEAGRLGYNTVASVQEYVEAASIINVALVDLGEGATQTIAKLSNIFGMEQMYGVRDSMLKIGSTVNHLSQNCTAAKPFIVEFAQRMAGIGATAKMTIPEIMAFAATLDANGQKVEMSATALQRTIMELFKRPAEMAKKVGLETNAFIETLNKSTTDGVIMFLDALNKLGEDKALAVLSPLFQDLGLDGARVSSVLSNLSSHLDFLKWQLGEAANAFRDGTSASNEYAIFNNTVQASIDKAKKRVSELAIELGEKLYPLMKHIYTSSSTFLRVLNSLVDFILQNKTAILGLITVLGSYYITLGAVKTLSLAWNGVIAAKTTLINAYRIAVVYCRIAVIAFSKGLGAAANAMKLLNNVVKANPLGLLLSAVTAVATAIYLLTNRTSEFTKKMKEAKLTAADYNSELIKEQRNLDILFGKLQAAKQGTQEYKSIKDQIINQYGKYLRGLINEKGEIINLTSAYNRLAAAARNAAKQRALQVGSDIATDAYKETMSDNMSKLVTSLEQAGASTKDATRIAQQVLYNLQTTGTLPSNLVKEIESYKFGSWWNLITSKTPVNIVNDMIGATTQYNAAMKEINSTAENELWLNNYNEQELRQFIEYVAPLVKQGKSARVFKKTSGNTKVVELSPQEAKEALVEARAILSEKQSPADSPELIGGNPNFDMSDYSPYVSDKDLAKQERADKAAQRAQEAEDRRRAAKEKKEFKEALRSAKGDFENDNAIAIAEYSQGILSWEEFLQKKHDIEVKYYEDREKVYQDWNLQEDEDYQELLRKKAELDADWLKQKADMTVEQAKFEQSVEENQLTLDYYMHNKRSLSNEDQLQRNLFEIKIKYLKKMRDAYNIGSKERHDYDLQIAQANMDENLRRYKKYSDKIIEMRNLYDSQDIKDRFAQEIKLLDELFENKLISYNFYLKATKDLAIKFKKELLGDLSGEDDTSIEDIEEIYKKGLDNINYLYNNKVIEDIDRIDAEHALKKSLADKFLPDSAKPTKEAIDESDKKMKEMNRVRELYEAGIIDKKQYESAIARIEKESFDKQAQRVRQFGSTEANQLLDIYSAWKQFFDATEEDGGNWATRLATLAQSVFAVMGAGMQAASDFISAQADADIAIAEKKYDRQIELAEGNAYLTKKLEKEKEQELAKIKTNAANKSFAMQVIQAVAQTATNAINAYGAALKIPGVGLVMAPIAAAMAVAAGAMQIATIKKQQQAAAAKGYASGGFTPDGDKDKPVGIVHAGEWVASQKLTRNPKTRPLIEALDYAQRTNSIGSISAADVSSAIIAPFALNANASALAPVVNVSVPQTSFESNELTETLSRLNKRLDEPFVTVNTVAGDYGIQQAQQKYDKLIKNKSPKYRK